MSTQEQPVTASLVAEAQRLDFLPAYFGPRLMMRGEALVYAWLRRLCERYNGAYWHYYTLSDGGFYLAPDLAERLEIEVDGNGFRGELSADALIDRYHFLRGFAAGHPEAAAIYRAID